jgi:hypothetical protein
MNLSAVPIIDIGPFRASLSTAEGCEERRAEVAAEMKNACEQAGFFYVQNHGVPRSLIREVFRMSRIFFEELSVEQKNTVDARKSAAFRGYIRCVDLVTGCILGQVTRMHLARSQGCILATPKKMKLTGSSALLIRTTRRVSPSVQIHVRRKRTMALLRPCTAKTVGRTSRCCKAQI